MTRRVLTIQCSSCGWRGPRDAMKEHDEMHAVHARQLADDVLAKAGHGPARWCLRYHLAGNPGATTPEPAEGAMHDRNVLFGMGATHIEVVEVK